MRENASVNVKRRTEELSITDVCLAKAGNLEAMGRILLYYEKDIDRCLIKHMLLNDIVMAEDDIEDAKQEIRMKIMKAVKKFQFRE